MAFNTDGINQLGAIVRRGTRDLRLLAFTVFALSFGFGAFSAAYSNFAVQSLHLVPKQIGVVESVREFPGFLIFIVAALTMRVAEPILAGISLALVAVGVGAFCLVGSVPPLIVFSLVWSIGLHSWMTINPSMALSLAEKGNQGRRLGQLNGVAALGTLCGMGFVFLIGKQLGFRNIFAASGVAVAAASVAVSMISRDIGHAEKPRLVLKRRYSLYYGLAFLEGCRRQVFMTFALFVLVRNYHTSMRMVAALMILNNVVNILLSPRVGRLIDRVGERRVLIFCYSALIPVFLGYALIKTREVLYLMYCLDSLFFLGSIGLNTYLHRIAESEDVMPSLAMGVSFNHIAAVLVPVVGGYLWSSYSYPITFFGGAVIVAISVVLASRMSVKTEAVESLEAVPSLAD